MKDNVTAIVQARMGSSRLPGKVLKKIGQKNVIDHVFCRLKKSKKVNTVVLATSTSKDDDLLEAWALSKEIKLFRGSEEDVLNRYYEAAKFFSASTIVRITSDCPFIDSQLVDNIIDFHFKNKNDYTSNVHPPTYPDGLDVEVFSFKMLEKANDNADEDWEREHVTPYIWKKLPYLSNIKLGNYSCSTSDMSKIRLTVDYPEDLELMNRLYPLLEEDFNLEQIINVIEENLDLLKINSSIKRNEKLGKS